MKWILSAVAFLCVVAEAKLAWQKTPKSLALTNDGKVVWQFNHGDGHRKPCFHPLATMDGRVLTDFRPKDHLWHRAAWFSLKNIDGLNYWEENRDGLSAGRNETLKVAIETQADFSAEIRLWQSYHPPNQPELVNEERVVRVSAPDASGSYTLDWQHLFTARQAVSLHAPAKYPGLSLRISKALMHWSFLNSNEQSVPRKVHGDSAKWLSYQGTLDKGSAGLTFFDHPSNPRFPTRWFIVDRMPYFSPAFLYDGRIPLAKDERLALFYRLKVHGSAPDAAALNAEQDAFAQRQFELADRIDLVAQGAKLHEVYCLACHSVDKQPDPNKLGPTWYGLVGRSREVFSKAAGIHVVAVDDAYLERAILQPNQELAVRETGPQAGEAYPPSMPPYPHLTSQEVQSLIAYMRTLNEPALRGPAERWVVKQTKTELAHDRFEVIVKDRPLVYRVAMADVSTRALSVGLPGGFNYIFDPSTFSVKRAWTGGFLNLKAERSGRGQGYNSFGAAAEDTGLVECLLPLGPGGPISQDFKDYINNDTWRIERSKLEMASTVPFLEREAPDGAQFGGYRIDEGQVPTFLFRINGVDYSQQVAFESDQVLHYYFTTQGATEPVRFKIRKDRLHDAQCSVGSWQGDTLSIPPDKAASFTISITLGTRAPAVESYNLSEKARYPQKTAIAAVMKRLGLDKQANHAFNAKASGSGAADGDAIGPIGAVEGQLDTYWDEQDMRKHYRLKLALLKPHQASALSIVGWNHHDFAPKSFDLLINGKPIKTVTDAQYQQNLLLVRFPRSHCQTVELAITAWYGGSPAIRELGLYDLEEAK